MNDPQLINLLSGAGTAGAALFGLYVIARKFDQLSDRLLSVLTETVATNTRALQEFRDAVRSCPHKEEGKL